MGLNTIPSVAPLGRPFGGDEAAAGIAFIEEALYHLLSNDSRITALTTRIFPNIIPQGESLPAITYQQISGVRDNTIDDGPSGLCNARFQFNCWAEQYIQARQLASAVRKLLSGYSGTVEECEIYGIFLDNEGDMPRLTAGLDELSVYGKYIDFTIVFEEQLT